MSGLAVVTGASRGIGRATALALARRGCSLALVGRPTPKLASVAAECIALGVRAACHACELEDPEAITLAAAAIQNTQGSPDIVINNAAELVFGPLLHETSLTEWDRTMAVNLRAPFLLCRALMPAMLAQKRGRFVHVASISSTIGCTRAGAYATSKWGLVGFSKSLAEELRGTGLVSVAVLPGSVDTEMLAATPFSPQMTANDVANVIVYYALDAPAAVQGAAVELFG
ncbi:MAG: SDR family oxidoreductase [Myxococcales bacterium]|nr:SDR family oxidoreductase [Myxococcales bacterium]